MGTSRLVTVTCADHYDVIVEGLWAKFTSKRCTDFDFRWGGRSVRAHRLILELFLSPEVLDRGPGGSEKTECREPTGTGGEDSHDRQGCSLECLLEFLYNGNVTVREEELDDLLGVARELDFRLLVDAVEAARLAHSPLEEDTVTSPVDEEEDDVPSGGVSESRTDDRGPPTPKLQFDVVEGDTEDQWYLQVKKVTVDDVRRDAMEEAEAEEAACWTDSDRDFPMSADPLHLVSVSMDCPEDSTAASWDVCSGNGLMNDIAIASGVPRTVGIKSTTKRKKKKRSKATGDGALVVKSAPPVGGHEMYECLHCDFESESYASYSAHLNSIHQVPVESEPVVKKYKCIECGFACTTRRSLARHRRTVHSKEFKCLQCTYTFSDRRSVERHVQVVHLKNALPKPYLCNENGCNFRSMKLYNLKVHQRCHTGEKPYRCTLCERKFADPSAYRRHVRRHSFECRLCGRLFSGRNGLQAHVNEAHPSAILADVSREVQEV